MKSKILKFLTLAAALCGATAWGAQYAAADQAAFESAIRSCASGDTISLGSGEFRMNGMTGAKGKTITLKGAGKASTTLWYGSTSGYKSEGEAGSEYGFEGSTATFKDMALKDVNGSAPGYDGFVRANGLTFEGCSFHSMLTYLGSDNTTVTFRNCEFNSTGSNYVAWLYGTQTYNFENCKFNVGNRVFNVYAEHAIQPVVNMTDCDVVASGASKQVLNIKNSANTGAYNISGGSVTGLAENSTTGSAWYQFGDGNSGTAEVKINNQTVWAEGAKVEAAAPAVAKIGTTEYTDLTEAIKAALTANDGVPVELLSDIVYEEGAAWTPIEFNGGTVVIDGKGFTVTGLPGMLFDKKGSGGHHLRMSDITFDGAKVSGGSYAAVICGYADSMNELYFENVTIKNSTVSGTNYAAAFVGYAAGYSKTNDGPVFQQVTFKNCTVENCTITGGGSTGTLMGHAAGSTDAIITVEGTTVKNNTVKCSGSSTNKAGSLFGTAGNAGAVPGEAGQTAGIFVKSATVSGNTVTSGSTTITTICGRQGSTGGRMEVSGGIYDAAPFKGADSAWASVPAGYALAENAGSWTVEQDPTKCGYQSAGEGYAALPVGPDMSGDVVSVTPANIQYVLDGAYGSINGKTIHLSAGTYDQLVLGRPTKYAGSNTEYRHGSFSGDTMSYADYIAYKTQAGWTEYSYYTRAISNVKFTAEEGVTVAGVTAEGGNHVYGTTAKPVYDYVRDNGTWCPDANNGYYMDLKLQNIEFDGVSFTKGIDIATASDRSVFDGLTFKECSFTTGGTDKGPAIRYYSENNNGNVKNLVVEGCTFENCNQGVYTMQVNGITVKDSTFTQTGHNAIAIQSQGGDKGPCNHGEVVITGNTMVSIGDRAIRFNDVAAGTTITITGNTATYKDGTATDEQCIKATTLAEGVTTTVELNNWNNYVVAANKPLTETVAKIGTTDYKSLEDATEAAQGSDVITIVGYKAGMEAPDGWKFVTEEGVTTLELDVITISTVEELVAFSAAVNGGDRYANKIVRLTQDLDMTGIDFVPIGNVSDYPGKTFYGVFDGQNHTIRNLTVSDTTEDYASAALFGSLCGTVQNVKLENVNITSSHYAAALVGYSSDGNTTAVIKNCHVDGGTVTSTPEEVSAGKYDNGDKVGGLAGYLAQGVALEDCTVKNLTVTAYRDVAGLVGYANTGVTVKNSSVTDTTVVSDHRYNYKNYASDELYDANEIIGEASSSAVLTDNTFSNVDFAILENVAQITQAGTTTGFQTIAEALIAAQDGDTIEILAGTWGADAIGKLDEEGKYTNANIVRYKSLTIQPAEGAEVTFTSTLSLGYDDSSTANATMTVKNLNFDGASLALSNYVQVNVEGCTFKNGTSNTAGTLIVQDSCCKNHKTTGAYPASQVTIKNCTICGSNDGASGIRIRNSGNVEITGCKVENSKFNGILFESNSSVDNTPVKTISITENEITEWNATNAADSGRAMRLALGTLAEGSTVTIEDNVFRKETVSLDKPDFMKITGAGAATVSLEDNDWNDELRSTVSGNSDYYTVDTATPVALAAVVTTKVEPVAQIGTTKYATIAEAVEAAQAGDTVEVLVAGTYTLPNLPKNITIKGTVEGVAFNCQGSGSIASVPNGATFENVTFTLGNTNYHGFQHAGTINMIGCTVNGLLFSYGDMNFTECTFKQTANDYCMWCYGKDVTYTRCTFDTAGKALNVYCEGNSTAYNVVVDGCTFKSSTLRKAAVNIKETCGAKMLNYNVTVKDNCTKEGAWPEATEFDPANKLWVISPLVQVDDRNTSIYPSESGITVTKGSDLVYPMVTMLQLPVTADDGTKLLLTVPDTFFTDMVTYPAGATAAQKAEAQSAHLDDATVDANGLKVWQNYAMGVDGSSAANTLTTDYAVGAGEMITVKTPISAFNPPADSGITVTYRLLRTTTPEDATSWEVFGEPLGTPAFPVDLSTQTGDTFWKIEAVFTGEAVNE